MAKEDGAGPAKNSGVQTINKNLAIGADALALAQLKTHLTPKIWDVRVCNPDAGATRNGILRRSLEAAEAVRGRGKRADAARAEAKPGLTALQKWVVAGSETAKLWTKFVAEHGEQDTFGQLRSALYFSATNSRASRWRLMGRGVGDSDASVLAETLRLMDPRQGVGARVLNG